MDEEKSKMEIWEWQVVDECVVIKQFLGSKFLFSSQGGFSGAGANLVKMNTIWTKGLIKYILVGEWLMTCAMDERLERHV